MDVGVCPGQYYLVYPLFFFLASLMDQSPIKNHQIKNQLFSKVPFCWQVRLMQWLKIIKKRRAFKKSNVQFLASASKMCNLTTYVRLNLTDTCVNLTFKAVFATSLTRLKLCLLCHSHP